MERSKILLWVFVVAAAGVIIWRVGFHIPGSYIVTAESKAGAEPGPAAQAPNEPMTGETSAGDEPNAPADANVPTEPNKPAGGDQPDQPPGSSEPNKPGESPGAGEAKPAEPNDVGDPNDPLEAINLKDVEMKNIIEKIAKWTGKTVIPDDEVMKKKITIYAPEKLPRSKALSMIRSALRMKGYTAEEADDTIFLKPLKEARLGLHPTVGADEPLAMFENKDQIVRKFFKLKNYPPAQMGEVIRPLVAEYGHVSADETTGSLLVIETIANLMSIERVIAQFDVPEAVQTVEEFVEIHYGDPSEIVQLLRMLLGESPTGSSRGRSAYRGRPSPSRSGGPPNRGGSSGAASSVVIAAGDVPIVLIPVPRRKLIIVRGSANDVKRIHEWIAKLDVQDPVRSEYETVSIAYADPREVASRIEDALDEMPGTELKPSVIVQPLEQSRQIMIFGRADLRDMVKQLIVEIDIPAGTYETKNFELDHADPDQIKENIDNLYGENVPMYDSYYYYRYGAGSRSSPADTVKVISFPTMSQVTVIAAPENMRKIEKQIKEWDVPLDVDAVKPRIIELKNSDPVQMAELLTKLFTEEQDSSSSSLFRYIFFGGSEDQRKKIVGPLYGQLTFEEVPGTKKIIVISKIPQAYDVVEELIYELDRQEMAEVPKVVQIKYADPEDLAERLNAMFNEPGTRATIRRTERGIGDYSMDQESSGQQGGPRNDGGGGGGGGTSPGEYTPWWSAGARRSLDEEPISNVIGKVRFVPDPHSKSILVLAPPEFMPNIEKTIKELDIPGKQVMLKAVIMEVEHASLTSLGVQLTSDINKFATLDNENALTALTTLSVLEEQGSLTLTAGMNVDTLVDFLIKTTNAKILNQQTLWTKDNEEASFFKGDRVAFLQGSTISPEGRVTSQNVTYEKVGMTLAARPSITPEKRVDMNITVLLERLTSNKSNDQPVRATMETETNMIIEDAQTLMLGGILFQKDSKVQRKLPLFGDLPLIGGLFRHNEIIASNSELIVFVTPYVIDDAEAISAEAAAQIERPKERLKEMQEQLDAMAQKLKAKDR